MLRFPLAGDLYWFYLLYKSQGSKPCTSPDGNYLPSGAGFVHRISPLDCLFGAASLGLLRRWLDNLACTGYPIVVDGLERIGSGKRCQTRWPQKSNSGNSRQIGAGFRWLFLLAASICCKDFQKC